MDKPAYELKGFAKTPVIKAGDSVEVCIRVSENSLASFDERMTAWVIEGGAYTAHIAASSEDIRHSLPFSLPPRIVQQCHQLFTQVPPVDDYPPRPRCPSPEASLSPSSRSRSRPRRSSSPSASASRSPSVGGSASPPPRPFSVSPPPGDHSASPSTGHSASPAVHPGRSASPAASQSRSPPAPQPQQSTPVSYTPGQTVQLICSTTDITSSSDILQLPAHTTLVVIASRPPWVYCSVAATPTIRGYVPLNRIESANPSAPKQNN